MIGNLLSTTHGSYRLFEVDDCSSTNKLCFDYANDGEVGNLWITSKRQSQGRGSRNRQWNSREGNLFASLLLDNPAPIEFLAQLTFVAAVSTYDALLAVGVKENQIQLKWPNDVLIQSRKCSGILLESRHAKTGPQVVIGIGINCIHHPDDSLHLATDLLAEGVDVSAKQMFLHLAEAIANTLAIWDRGKGFQSIRSKWLEKAYGIGEPITVRIPLKEDIRGIFASIDEAGYMLLETSDKKQMRISTADIFFN